MVVLMVVLKCMYKAPKSMYKAPKSMYKAPKSMYKAPKRFVACAPHMDTEPFLANKEFISYAAFPTSRELGAVLTPSPCACCL